MGNLLILRPMYWSIILPQWHLKSWRMGPSVRNYSQFLEDLCTRKPIWRSFSSPLSCYFLIFCYCLLLTKQIIDSWQRGPSDELSWNHPSQAYSRVEKMRMDQSGRTRENNHQQQCDEHFCYCSNIMKWGDLQINLNNANFFFFFFFLRSFCKRQIQDKILLYIFSFFTFK